MISYTGYTNILISTNNKYGGMNVNQWKLSVFQAIFQPWNVSSKYDKMKRTSIVIIRYVCFHVSSLFHQNLKN